MKTILEYLYNKKGVIKNSNYGILQDYDIVITESGTIYVVFLTNFKKINYDKPMLIRAGGHESIENYDLNTLKHKKSSHFDIEKIYRPKKSIQHILLDINNLTPENLKKIIYYSSNLILY